MPIFALTWKQIFHEDYGSDREIVTGNGILEVRAKSRVEVDMEIAKFEGCQTNYRENIIIASIEESREIEGSSLSAIGYLLDPYNSRDTRSV